MDMNEVSKHNDSIRFILVAINCFSKFGYCVPLKDKKAITVSKAMDSILSSSQNLIGSEIVNIQTDDGSEFKGAFSTLMNERGINHYKTYSDLKACIVERLIKTFKMKLYPKMAIRSSLRYIDFLQEVVDDYNNSNHRTIHMTPKEASRKVNEKLLQQTVFKNHRVRVVTKFKIGDSVRISNKRFIFSRGFHTQFSTEVFKVHQVNNKFPPTYKLSDHTGEVILGSFYEPEMTSVAHEDVFLVERVIRRRGDKDFVKWLGYEDRFNSWIKRSDYTQDL